MKNKSWDIIIFWMLLIGIVILFLNDHIWKYEFSNFATGKISDFVGLFTFTIFIGVLMPKCKKWIALLVGLGFIIWKLPISEVFIEFWNEYSIVRINRVVDYSDLFALFVLPVSHMILSRMNVHSFRNSIRQYSPSLVLNSLLFLSALVFCSTSVSEPIYPSGDVLINQTYIVNKSEQDIISGLEKLGLDVTVDSIGYSRVGLKYNNLEYYRIDELVVKNGIYLDTLSNLNFRIFKDRKGAKLYIINLSVKDKWALQDWGALKKRSLDYQKLLKRELIDKLK